METNNNPLPKENTQIQLVVNRPEEEDDTIDLGRVFHNMKLKSRIYAWVLVLCLVVGVAAPLLLYQFNKPALTVTSVVTLRYDVPADKAGILAAPDGSALDLNTVTSAPVLQKALDGLSLSQPVTIENLRNNMTVTRVLTEESSRAKEALAGLVDAKNADAYRLLEETELRYQNRFIVSLTNGFGDEESRVKYDLKDEELRIVLNRILDAYNETLIRQYADFRLPEDKVSLIDVENLDIPEVLDSLNSAMASLLNYCERQPASVRSYRSWQTGLSLNDWIQSIHTVQSVQVDYLEAYVYSQGIIRDKELVTMTYQYRIRTLQNELDKLNENIANTQALLKNYKNNQVLVSQQESDSTKTTKLTTEYYNDLVLLEQNYYSQATNLRTEISKVKNNLERLGSNEKTVDVQQAEEELRSTVAAVAGLQESIRAHMTELFDSPIFTTYTEHSVPQGKLKNFLVASARNMVIGGVVGVVIACGLWFLAALAPEFRRNREDDDAPKAEADGKEAAQA